MSEIVTGFNLYLGVILGQLAIAGVVFLGCLVLAVISCILNRKNNKGKEI